MDNIRDRIIENRKHTIRKKGYTFGKEIPQRRKYPPVPFDRNPFLICEIKRKSPSKGSMADSLNPVFHAGEYISRGVKSISVLTEENYFGGSLDDLINIKKAYPGIAVLRKDFLLDEEEIEISYLAGADAVLLIAGVLSEKKLDKMYSKCEEYGLSALVEVHSPDDVKKIRKLKPKLTGINSRDLSTFRIDLALPLKIRKYIDWDTSIVFESGIHSEEDAVFAKTAGFSGILVGEAVIKDPKLITDLISGLNTEIKTNFWNRIFSGIEENRPLVKICGLTRIEDAKMAAESGADMIGFVFADSPRRADSEILRGIKNIKIPKAGIVVRGQHGEAEAYKLLNEGFIDVIQFHGDEKPAVCYKKAFPYYKALRPRSERDIDAISGYGCPRVLFDTFSKSAYGGSGKRINRSVVNAVKEKYPLWLAGGIGPDNVREIIRDFSPELIDLSSSLEKEPGIKDHGKIRQLFREIDNA